ncbi:MAG: hypothetical protein EOP49_05940 [Sphingobacteriales bacterium]|nr:MAG: hypothetical protein EOP49_05940 [Sphingobacteriales bacterium]
MTKLVPFLLLLATLCFCQHANAQVEVSSTAGTTSPTNYTTLKAALDAINAGTHQGTVTVSISANTIETAPATLNSGDAAPAAYSSVLIRPVTDGVSVSLPTSQGFGVIQLKGADNVTIDGDNPNTVGVNRNLTIQNAAAATTTYTSVIRIANAASVTSSNNITLKNLVITGNADGLNLSTATSTTGSENTSFGIYAGGNGGTTQTDAPTAISSVTTNSAPNATTINNLVIHNNVVNACARGIVFNGANATVSTDVSISDNTIGGTGTLSGTAPFTSPLTTVYTKGIYVSGTTSVSISGNTLRNIISYVATPVHAIELASAIGSGPVEITNNTINGVVNNGANSNAPKGIVVTNAVAGYTVSGNTISNIQWMGSTTTATQSVCAIYMAAPFRPIRSKHHNRSL